MPRAEEARRELGELLKARRRSLPPPPAETAGPRTGRRTPGWRREEVALRAGVGLTWYTWLEQGRDIAPSRAVLEAVARALELSPDETAYVLRLGGQQPEPSPEQTRTLPEHAQRVLDAWSDAPAYAITADWHIVGWNRPYEALFPRVAQVEPDRRNLLRLLFTDPAVRGLLADWETDVRRFLATFRAEAGPRLDEPLVSALVTGLVADSPEFASAWAERDIESFRSRVRRFRHPRVGELALEHHQLGLAERPDLQLVVYTPEPGSVSARRLEDMLTAHH